MHAVQFSYGRVFSRRFIDDGHAKLGMAVLPADQRALEYIHPTSGFAAVTAAGHGIQTQSARSEVGFATRPRQSILPALRNVKMRNIRLWMACLGKPTGAFLLELIEVAS